MWMATVGWRRDGTGVATASSPPLTRERGDRGWANLGRDVPISTFLLSRVEHNKEFCRALG